MGGETSPSLNDGRPYLTSILVVDDNPAVLESVSMMVSKMGLGVHQAKDGMEAVERFQANSKTISLVIMDVEMPRLGGIEATHRIRAINPSAKIVLFSGYTKQDVWKAKPNAFLQKPFMHIELRDVIHNLLNDGGGRESK